MKRLPLFFFVAVFSGLITFLSCGPSKKNPVAKSASKSRARRSNFVLPKPVSQDYVGSESCRECHAEIMKEYESHAMSQSMSITRESSIEDYISEPKFEAAIGLTYEVQRDVDKVVHREMVSDKTNIEIVSHDEVIDFTCGSGTRGCSYFVFRDGKLFQSPVTWYGKSKKWDLSPGYHPPAHPRFERMASDGCLACHAGTMNPVPSQRNTFDEAKPFLELAIGCERCHGPAKAHIEFHNAPSRKPDEMDPIVNPSNLTPEKRDAVCYQCHLQGENRVTRYGRSEYDFRPGMFISDIWVPFLKSGKAIDGETEAVSQVEQMRQSKCFTESNGALGCISCHDPHKSPTDDGRIDFYRNQCIECHQKNEQPDCGLARPERLVKSPKDSCVQCHMPKLNAGDVPHTPQTDHRVQLPGKPFQYESTDVDGFRIWSDGQIPIVELARAKTISLAEKAYFSRDPQVIEKAMEGLQYFHPPADDDLLLNEALAQLYWAQGEHDNALILWKKLLQGNPKDEFLLAGIAFSLQESNRIAEAYQYYKRLIEVNDSRPETLRGFVDVCTQLQKYNEGMEAAKRILELDPGSQLAHAWLAKAYQNSNDVEKAAYHSDMAKKLAAAQAK